MITTSHDPSARLKKFVKEVRLLFPNAQRLNRGNYEYKQVRETDGGQGSRQISVKRESQFELTLIISSSKPAGRTT